MGHTPMAKGGASYKPKGEEQRWDLAVKRQREPLSFKRHRFPADMIRHAVWRYFRFSLSFRDVEELLAAFDRRKKALVDALCGSFDSLFSLDRKSAAALLSGHGPDGPKRVLPVRNNRPEGFHVAR